MSDRSIQKMLAAYEPLICRVPQPQKIRKAIYALSRCRTNELGSSYYRCPEGHEQIEHAHSCRHRSCSVCGNKGRLEWIEKQKQRLLDVAHFHVVFTIPHEYLNLWRYNERLMIQILFRAAQQTLLQLMGEEKHHGVVPGILMALHTWGRQLNLHPHVHCVVTGGGVTATGDWKDTGDYLLPGSILRAVFRGKFQSFFMERLEDGLIVMPPQETVSSFKALHRSLYKKDWNVRVEDRYEHGKGVVMYLARYCRGGPVHPRQLKRIDADEVVMSYLDHRTGRVCERRLPPEIFARQLLQHVAPTGQHTIRYYGLYSAGAKRRYEGARELHGTIDHINAGSMLLKRRELACRHCGRDYQLISRQWQKGNSINKSVVPECANGPVQQRDEVGIANVQRNRDPCHRQV